VHRRLPVFAASRISVERIDGPHDVVACSSARNVTDQCARSPSARCLSKEEPGASLTLSLSHSGEHLTNAQTQKRDNAQTQTVSNIGLSASIYNNPARRIN
jgi:hypothetical protein